MDRVEILKRSMMKYRRVTTSSTHLVKTRKSLNSYYGKEVPAAIMAEE